MNGDARHDVCQNWEATLHELQYRYIITQVQVYIVLGTAEGYGNAEGSHNRDV